MSNRLMGEDNHINSTADAGCISYSPAINIVSSFPHLSISLQNCNSLNISTDCDKQLAKIVAITSARSSIILLSDLRLCANVNQIEKIRKIFLTNSNKSYQFFYNSEKNSRGVGILIDSSLSFSITDSFKDANQNILGLNLKIDGTEVFIASIYGPNDNDKCFFEDLTHVLSLNCNLPIIIGGDWNTTYSTGDNGMNIDIINMLNPPSKLRSSWLSEICDNSDLIDPYRAFYPTKRDFTYIPRGLKKNRSRLDFFLMSSSLLPFCKRCIISDTVSSSLFDHKSVTLSFLHEKLSSKLVINRTILSNPRTDDIVLAAYADTYLAHARSIGAAGMLPQHVFRQNNLDPLDEQRVTVGTFLRQLKELNDLIERARNEPDNNLLQLLIAEKETEIEITRAQIWSVEQYSDIELSCDDDFFFEALASNIKGSVVSFQAWVKKVDNLIKANLIGQLNNLKKDFNANSSAIYEIESRLGKIVDAETLLKVRSMKLFSCLNSEKPTPMFLSLARSSNAGSNLSCICRPDGSQFPSDADKVEHIVSYFENIYRIPTSDCRDYNHCIENFLGHDILGHPIVMNSKLTLDEKVRLDSPLTVEELDSSMEKCNLRSAPGIDGMSNVFIKKYWQYFRIPLFKYANSCLYKKRLTSNFRSASIKLIPKKGDLSDLKNWRPISLLSNMYKIISRAINARLNTVVNRICSRAQKGFNNQRYTQECLINVIETIAHCKVNDINGAVVAVDMAKAFDTLSHGFLREVFKFFNMGEGMIDWLTLLGENRTACILLDNGSYSRNFRLDRGRAQGDNISPNTFNFAEQILILKIELDPGINGIWKNFVIPPDFPANTNSFFMCESLGETSKNESLADDNTTLMMMEDASLARLRCILDEFGKISGLKCNYDKTVIVPVGKRNPIPVSSTGFQVSNTVKLLGMEISNELDNVDDIFIQLGEKILNLILFWSRFRLSLSGRIAILKTLLIPQLNYLGCFLTPSRLVIDNLQSLLDDFALNGLRIGKDRYYIPPDQGGLGLIHLGTFLIAQKCSWVKRTHSNTIDNWRLRFRMACPNFDVTLASSIDFDRNCSPVLFEIASAFGTFVNCFGKIGNNLLELPLFQNPNIVRSSVDNRLIDINFFGREFYNRHCLVIRKLTINNCYENGNFKTLGEFHTMNLPLTVSMWVCLRSAVLLARKKMTKSDSAPVTLDRFLRGIKKGSKKFREVIDRSIYQSRNVLDTTTVNGFASITKTTLPNEIVVKNFVSGWNCTFLDNDFREFIFKCRNNILRTGDRLSHILPNSSDSCKFCIGILPGTVHRESFLHLFRECVVTSSVLLQLNIRCKLKWDNPNVDFNSLYWYGNHLGNLDRNVLLFYDVFRYQIWSMKLRKIIEPSALIENVFNHLRAIFFVKPSIKLSFARNNNLASILQAMG